jgi:hypothetical protein
VAIDCDSILPDPAPQQVQVEYGALERIHEVFLQLGCGVNQLAAKFSMPAN